MNIVGLKKSRSALILKKPRLWFIVLIVTGFSNLIFHSQDDEDPCDIWLKCALSFLDELSQSLHEEDVTCCTDLDGIFHT